MPVKQNSSTHLSVLLVLTDRGNNGPSQTSVVEDRLTKTVYCTYVPYTVPMLGSSSKGEFRYVRICAETVRNCRVKSAQYGPSQPSVVEDRISPSLGGPSGRTL